MMIQKSLLLATFALSMFVGSVDSFSENEAPAPDKVARDNLVSLWRSQIHVDGARNEVVEIHLHVHDDRASTYFELTYPGFRQTVSVDDLNPRGIRFGDVYPEDPIRGAMEWAKLQKEILERRIQQEVSMTQITVPQATLYSMTNNGGIHAMDAETGKTRWKTRVGKVNEPAIGIASTNTHVVAVQGSRIFCLDALTGEEVWSRTSKFAPGGGVSASDGYAYITSVTGRLQIYPLNKTGLPVSFFSSTGSASFDPVVTANTVSWATEKGFLNVAKSDSVGLRYRLETDAEFRAPGAVVGKHLIVNSTRGDVIAIDERLGAIDWEFAAGERLDRQPIAAGGNAVMLISAEDRLIFLNSTTGQVMEGWPKRVPGIRDYVGASQDVLYFLSSTGQLTGIDRATGATTSVNNVPAGAITIPNPVTDRLYLAEPNGAIRCFRESGNVNPVVRGDGFVVSNSAGEAELQGSGSRDAGSGTKDGSGNKNEGSGSKDEGSGSKDEDGDPFGG